jgi:altronate hydrolase
MKNNILKVNRADNVAVALVDIAEGETLVMDGEELFAAIDHIPYSHKVALTDFSAGDRIIKYGESIGEANQSIQKGQWVHSHNLGIGGEPLG